MTRVVTKVFIEEDKQCKKGKFVLKGIDYHRIYRNRKLKLRMKQRKTLMRLVTRSTRTVQKVSFI